MKSSVLWVVIVLIVLGLGWYFLAGQAPAPQAPLPSEEMQQTTGEETGSVADILPGAGASVSAFTVRYTADGFSPSTMTVPAGATVTFINQGGGEMWVASDEHPSHTIYSGTTRSEHCPDTTNTTFDQCARGNTFSFTFTKAGTWEYHNHVASSDRGTIVVE